MARVAKDNRNRISFQIVHANDADRRVNRVAGDFAEHVVSILIFAAVDGESCLAPIRADTCGLQLPVGLDRCLDQPTQQVALVTLLECLVFISVEHVAGHGRAAVVVAGVDHDVRARDAQRGGNQVAVLVGRVLTDHRNIHAEVRQV
jgi:hypothetical protein